MRRIQKYMNTRKVPQLFLFRPVRRDGTIRRNFPLDHGLAAPTSQNEARIYAKYILKEKPDARIAVLLTRMTTSERIISKGLKDGLGDKACIGHCCRGKAYDVDRADNRLHISSR